MKTLEKPAKKARAPAGRRTPGSRPRERSTGRRTRLTKPAIAEMFHRLQAADPHPKSELEYVNPFTLLVAVVLSAQTTDKKVNEVTPALFARAATPAAMAALDEEEILLLIREIGLNRQKAKRLKRLSELLLERHGGEVPRSFEELEALPGVGHKTASVVMARTRSAYG